MGLGYVGLPVAAAFAASGCRVIGFDVNKSRVAELKEGVDRTQQIDKTALCSENLLFTEDANALRQADFHIITVPTPVRKDRKPDLHPLISASRTVGRILKKGDVVVYESTVYPGATEEDCIPILEAESGLVFGEDFTVGYSPERINPGDQEHTFESIKKVVSGSDEATLELVANVYGSVVHAGVHRAPSIKVAEAAKVIENSQRDLNIAFMNELALIFDRIGVSTHAVLEAAATKWNFLPFKPGLVGGHCISVDPYYLIDKAQKLNFEPEVLLAGRRTNDLMPQFIVSKLERLLGQQGKALEGAKVGVLGLTFKENVPDLRNSKVIDIVTCLQKEGASVDVHDPHACPEELERDFGLITKELPQIKNCDAVILAVPHNEYIKQAAGLLTGLKPGGVFADLKSALRSELDSNDLVYWSF